MTERAGSQGEGRFRTICEAAAAVQLEASELRARLDRAERVLVAEMEITRRGTDLVELRRLRGV